MNFEELLAMLKNMSDNASFLSIGFLAVQVNVTGANGGVFYIEIKNGKATVAPYEYNDCNCVITISMNELNRLFTSGTSRTGAKADSILVQVDEETASLMKTISNSISGEISAGLEKMANSSEKNDDTAENIESGFKKLTKRVDNMEEKMEDMNDTIESVKSEIHKQNLTLNKMMKLLNQMASEEKSE